MPGNQNTEPMRETGDGKSTVMRSWSARAQGAFVESLSHFTAVIGVCASALLLPLLFDSAVRAEESADKTTYTESPYAAPGGEKPIVRSIKVEVLEIFDEPDVGLFYRAVNGVKLQTREEVVKRELLIKEGEPFDQFLLEESERNLRTLSFLREVSITPVFDGAYVDLLVQVQDTWTLFPFIALSSGGGTQKSAVGVTESNLLGYGKRLEALVADDEGRQKIEAVWQDPRVFGTYQQFTLGTFQRSDGNRTFVSYGRPFRSVVEKNAWNTSADHYDLVGRLFEGGDERYIFRTQRTAVNGGYTLSFGNPKEQRRRYTFGYGYSDDEFTQADDSDFDDINLEPDPTLNDPSMLPEDRRFSGPTVAFEQINQDFLSINFLDRFERVEDINLGNELNFSSQIAPEALNSKNNTLLLSASDSQGLRLSPTSFLRGALGVGGRLDEVGFRQVIGRAEARYYNVTGAQYVSGVYVGKHTLASSLVLEYGESLDKDSELLLGASNGLRGYEDRSFTGDQRLVFNAEDRFHLVEDVLRLVSLGGAFFVDAGGTSRSGFGDIVGHELYADVGFGLRFGLPRSSGGNVVRLDIAFPLRDGVDDDKAYQPRILITTGQLFSAFLSTERSSSVGISSALLQ